MSYSPPIPMTSPFRLQQLGSIAVAAAVVCSSSISTSPLGGGAIKTPKGCVDPSVLEFKCHFSDYVEATFESFPEADWKATFKTEVSYFISYICIGLSHIYFLEKDKWL